MTADEFRALRTQAGLSPTEAARALGVTRQAIWLWETEKRQSIPSHAADTLRAIAQQRKEPAS